MILSDLAGTEADRVYRTFAKENAGRLHGFLRSVLAASLASERPVLSHAIIKAFNFHAIACLHPSPGEYRSCAVKAGGYSPPEAYRVPALMDELVDTVNRTWEKSEAVALASFTLWRVNAIHPFINGNGRTARAASYFVLCAKWGGLLPGDAILPDLLKQDRDEYVAALRAADTGDLAVLTAMVQRLVAVQVGATERPSRRAAAEAWPEPEASTSAENAGET